MNVKNKATQGLNLQVHRLNFIIDSITNNSLKKNGLGITNAQYLILKSVFILDKPSQVEIASYLNLSPAAVSRHIKNLEEKKYLKIIGVSKRSHVIKFTKKGRRLFLKTMEILQLELKNKISNYDKVNSLLFNLLQEDIE